MKIDIYPMLKTLLFTLENGKNISSGMQLLSNTAKTKAERKVYTKIHNDLKEGLSFASALKKYHIGSLDVIQFITMAEKGVSFRLALEKVIHYIEIKEDFERESNDKTSLPFLYFFLAFIVVIGVKFFAVPYQIERSLEYGEEIIAIIGDHLDVAQLMTDILFISVLLIAGYFAVLLTALFSQSHFIQSVAKQLALFLPFSSKIVMKFEKFMLFSMMGEMLQSGISYKKVMESASNTTTINYFRKALKESLESIKYEGKFILHNSLFDDIEQGLLAGVGSSTQIGVVMMEISKRAKGDALALATKFFRLVVVLSILLLAFAVFIEFYTVVLTQILVQKGLIDMVKGASF